jgi:hypothetical protein
MSENLNNKEFIDFVKNKINLMINEIFILNFKSNEFNLKKNEIKTFLLSLIKDSGISNTNKISFCFLFFETFNNYKKDWIVKLFTKIIIKINSINQSDDYLVNNEYFIFKILSEKEDIKNIINIHLNLIYVSNILIDYIYSFSESKSIFNNNEINKISSHLMNFNEKIKKNFSLKFDEESNKNFNLLFDNYLIRLENIVNNFEDEYINLINNKYIFEKKK